MIRLEPIEKIVKIALYTPYVKSGKSVSILLIGKPEQGKTETLKMFCIDEDKGRINDSILYINDFTAHGIINDHGTAIQEGKIKTIVCPEFLKIVSRKQSSVKDTLAFPE